MKNEQLKLKRGVVVKIESKKDFELIIRTALCNSVKVFDATLERYHSGAWRDYQQIHYVRGNGLCGTGNQRNVISVDAFIRLLTPKNDKNYEIY